MNGPSLGFDDREGMPPGPQLISRVLGLGVDVAVELSETGGPNSRESRGWVNWVLRDGDGVGDGRRFFSEGGFGSAGQRRTWEKPKGVVVAPGPCPRDFVF